ncbi:MAG: cytochrome C oxidase subunit IV family protein [Buchnera aphidicola (Meitanaphis elongallis)]
MNFSYLKNILTFRNKYFFYILNLIILTTLTILPFVVVIQKIYSKKIISFIVVLCLIIQVCIHIRLFLHLNVSDNYKWNVVSMLFSFSVILTILLGSYWVMNNLNHNIYYSTI